MAVLFRRYSMFYNPLRKLHMTKNRCCVPTFEMKTERQAFMEVLPEIMNSVVTSPKLKKVPEIASWMKKLLEHTLVGGKLGRGLMVSIGYRMFVEPEHFSEETQHSARILGWCLEMLQSKFLILDDILDGGTMRRGKPCWHLQPNVGLSGINDALLIYHSMLDVLDMYFGKTPIYADLLRQFNETVYIAIMGEHLDIWSSYNKEKNNFDVLKNDQIYKAIAEYKTAYYCFKLPLFLPLLLVKNGHSKATKELHNICMNFGRLMQCQDDYMDAYGNETITGKNSRDIHEGKCSWVAVTALQHCNDAQRAVFKEYYGSKDPEHVKRIKQLYDELHLPQLYEKCERTIYDDILQQICVLPNQGDRIFLLEVLNANYK